MYNILGWICIAVFFTLLTAALYALAFRAARWCLISRWKFLRIVILLALVALGSGVAYGLLRLTGLYRIPLDNTYSFNFFDASWRDDGVHWLLACGGPFAGLAAAWISSCRHSKRQQEPPV